MSVLSRLQMKFAGLRPEDFKVDNPFECDIGDLPRSEFTYPPCSRCGSENTHISYYGCDSDPYPFNGFGVDCWDCGAVFDSIGDEKCEDK